MMKKGLNFAVDKPGFPIVIGGVELWFDNSLEGVVKFFDAEEIIQEKLRELQEESKDIDMPEDLENIDLTKISKEDFEKTIELTVKALTIQYDTLLGEGSFAKIYEKNKDVRQLGEIFPIIDRAIGQELEEKELARPQLLKDKAAEYLAKKAKKK